MIVRDVLSDVRRAVHFRRAQARAARARAGRAPRILVIGICQGRAVAEAMTLLLPDADLTFLSAFDLAARMPRMADLIALARAHDHVFTNVYLPPFADGGTIDTFREAVRPTLIPTIVFAAFHPDQVRIGRPDRPGQGGILGPMGDSHSALALFGFLEGLDVAATLRLFDEAVYGALGYLAMWEPSVAALRALGAQAGYDLDADLVRWSRRGCFMHSDNHPKMYVAADLARGLLDRAGIVSAPCDLDSYLLDTLLNGGSWPVYPPIARHYGLPGNDLFLKVETPRTGPARTMSLRSFVEAVHARYAGLARERLACPRVEAWRADPALRAHLLDVAARTDPA